MPTIDLNADMGEECGDDAALLAVVTTASVAAGGHAGGGDVLARTVGLAAAAGVAVGAHPSYPDRREFGRVSRAADHDAASVRAFVREQVLAVASACASAGIGLAHVKAHGALYNDLAFDEALATAVLDGLLEATGPTPVMGLPHSALERVSAAHGLPFLPEAFADRAYLPNGTLVPRSQAGAVLHDPQAIAERVLRLAMEGSVVAVDGTHVPVPAVTVCLHGDTPGAVEIARVVRRHLEDNGVSVAPIGRVR